MEDMVKMKNMRLMIWVLAILALALGACTPAATQTVPTTDPVAAYTQAAATVAANLTQDAMSNPQPTATPEPPTNTPPPAEPSATPTLDPALPTATSVAGTSAPVPSATKAAGSVPTVPDQAELIGQSPEDNTVMALNHVFNTQFTLKNTGTTTWTTAYTLRYYAGEKMGAPNDLNLTKEVKPGESITILFQMTAPSTKMDTNTVFVLTNKDGVNFYSMFVKLKFQ